MRLSRSLFALLLSYTVGAAAQSQGSFIPTGNMTVPRVSHTATLLLDGKVLIAGGTTISANPPVPVLASAELYDPERGTFSPTGNMTRPHSGHTATLVPDGRVLIVDRNSAELYDPSTGTFLETGGPDILAGTATLLDTGKVLIAAATPQLYDPATGTVAPTGSYAGIDTQHLQPWLYGLGVATATLLPDGNVLIAGEPFTELYDPLKGTFSVGQTMATRPYGVVPMYIDGRTGTLLTNGKVLLAGGDNEDLGYFADAELYDPKSGRFTGISSMARNRMGHTATLLRDGTVLLAGAQYGAAVASTELYDPIFGTFTVSGDMTVGRFFHTATLLTDGRILIAGGFTGGPGVLSAQSHTAELYVPAVLIPAPVGKSLRFDRPVVVAGTSYAVYISGANLTPQTYFDVRFTSPGADESAVVLNWQQGLLAIHGVDAGVAAGTWTITGVRAHEIETDHTGNFFPVTAAIAVVR